MIMTIVGIIQILLLTYRTLDAQNRLIIGIEKH